MTEPKRARAHLSARRGAVDWLTCPCGKRRYFTRSDARKIAHRLRESGVMTPYRCPDYPVGWHLGHHPDGVGNGALDKDTWLRKVSEAK